MDTIDVLRLLVGFDTNSRNSNLELIDWVAEFLEGQGARLRFTRNDDGAKANLLASLGPDRSGGIVLSGHTDVVPVDDQAWQSDPFVLTECDGRLHGRGAADMKGFIAACLAAVPGWAAYGLHRPIHLAFSYDEELGCLGISRLVQDMTAHVAPPALAIIGEPTDMRLGDGHRGCLAFETVFEGQAAHSSDPSLGTSAIAPAADFVRYVLDAIPRVLDQGSGTTVNVGRIDGGTALNIVPCRCAVTWEFRPGDGAAARRICTAVDDFIASTRGNRVGIASRAIARVPPLPRPDPTAAAMMAELGAAGPAVPLPFGTEAGFFQEAGIPAVVCGPGSIDQAHRPDEWIARDQLAQADAMMQAIGAWVRRKAP
ncbi:acetylornithine deacetylase [Desertibaculum subflavum]|uniref:acetylornithine deacetylase n=1 Tax=Desertibaculum subflavum TaxID=2268458 RepID=UPI000E6673F4